MPRKTRGFVGRGAARRRFNEAAARCRGKLPRLGRLAAALGASMRPRPDAAENAAAALQVAGQVRASMRPRPDAAENARRGAGAARRAPRFNEAAARCRGKLLETGPAPAVVQTGFNEAAARCRGKPSIRRPGRVRGAALQ